MTPNAAAVTLFIVWLPAAAWGAEARLYEMAKPAARPPGAPKYSDVSTRSLARRPMSADDPHDTFKAAGEFHLTRLEWCYLSCANADKDKAFVDEAHRLGLTFGGTLNSCLPDEPGEKDCLKGRVTGKDGKLKTAPWMPEWRNWGCANSPEYRKTYLEHAKRNIDAGVDLLQMDDPRMAVSVKLCYCGYCAARFEEYKKTHGPDADYEQFQKDSITEFFREMREEINRYAGRRVPMSNNNPIGWTNTVDWTGDGFDFIIGEVRSEHATPQRLRKNVLAARDRGQALAHTMWERDAAKERRVFAFMCANGGRLLVPWDVYCGSAPRYFGRSEEYADLTGFIRANAKYLDGYEEACVAGEEIAEGPPGAPRPVSVEQSGGEAYAFVRARPGEPDAPVVVHMVEWSLAPKPFKARLDNRRFFGDAQPKVELLVTPPYDRTVHERAEENGDYSSLSTTAPLNVVTIGDSTDVYIPALRPWGMLVVSKDRN